MCGGAGQRRLRHAGLALLLLLLLLLVWLLLLRLALLLLLLRDRVHGRLTSSNCRCSTVVRLWWVGCMISQQIRSWRLLLRGSSCNRAGSHAAAAQHIDDIKPSELRCWTHEWARAMIWRGGAPINVAGSRYDLQYVYSSITCWSPGLLCSRCLPASQTAQHKRLHRNRERNSGLVVKCGHGAS